MGEKRRKKQTTVDGVSPGGYKKSQGKKKEKVNLHTRMKPYRLTRKEKMNTISPGRSKTLGSNLVQKRGKKGRRRTKTENQCVERNSMKQSYHV